jgi:CubicO group peptidase (beta-lactamase class C family)
VTSGRGPALPLVLAAAAIAATCTARSPHPGASVGIANYAGVVDLYAFAESHRAKHALPALGVGIVRDGKIRALGMAGERVRGSDDWAAIDDSFDVASIAKPVTATVAALLVERGIARWDTSVGEVFADLRDVIRPEYLSVTLEMLLRHRGGLDQRMNRNDRWAAWPQAHARASATDQRRLFVDEALRRPPRSAPGTTTFYSNDGYIVAGSMLERLAGQAWEDLARNVLFVPYGLTTMRYGAAPGPVGSVWGHEDRWFGGSRPVPSDAAEFGSPPFGSPAGFLWSSLADLLRFADVHIAAAHGAGRELSRDSSARLLTPTDSQTFAAGWEVETKRRADGTVIERSVYHGGYSGRFRANVWFSPESRTGTAIVYNDGAEAATGAYADVFYALLREP